MQLSFLQTQKQDLKLSTQMIQSLSLFGLSTLELREFILSEIDKNPALELKKDPLESSLLSKRERPSSMQKTMIDSDNLQNFLESRPDEHFSLQSHLLEQLQLCSLSSEETELCKKIIQNLNQYGFCIEDPPNLFFDASIKKIPLLTPKQEKLLKKSLQVVKNLDPKGCASKNLQEYLLFQAEYKNANSLTVLLLKDYFNFLENPRISVIKKKLVSDKKNNETQKNYSLAEIENALAVIKNLQPYPSHNCDFQKSEYIIPEILMEYDNELKKITVHISNNQLPIAEISQEFIALRKNISDEKNINDFIKKQIDSAQWLLNTVNMRTHVLYKIAQALLNFQHDFFLRGQKYLKPLRLKDVAQSIDVHETTVSRLANGKFIQCNWGIFEIKYFFSSSTMQKKQNATAALSKPAISRDVVKMHIVEIMNNFKQLNKKISDEKIVQELAVKGIVIARRTVAKYRSEL
ncbi:MAG: RNA polymerase factor sigma-54 [Treponemataceae bacterium]